MDWEDILFGGLFGLVLSLFVPGFMRKTKVDPFKDLQGHVSGDIEDLEAQQQAAQA